MTTRYALRARPVLRLRPVGCVSIVFLLTAAAAADRRSGTFSIVAYDPATQELGVAVQSRYFSVGTTIPCARRLQRLLGTV
jgi:hypothetical protein